MSSLSSNGQYIEQVLLCTLRWASMTFSRKSSLYWILQTRYALAICFVCSSTLAHAQNLGFSCEGREPPPEKHVWRYTFEIDQQTSKGVQRGLNYGGTPYSKDIEVVLTPERMQIRTLGARDFTGYIDRRTLAFNFGGAVGSCKKTEVAKPKLQF